MKGLIALDIDGTTTPPGQPIAQEVISFLQELVRNQWQLVFVTGRTFHFGYQVVGQLPFPYLFCVQNGAITIEMPTRTIVNKKYLESGIIPTMEHICESEPSDFIIYAGFEHEDACYFRSHQFSDELREYLKARTAKFQEKWIDVPSFDNLHIDSFASVKCFGKHASALAIAEKIEKELGLHVPLIRDPFRADIYVAQATHPSVSKGEAVRQLAEQLQPDVIIAAGDDYNDLTMFEAADIKVVMATAPQDILALADIIAPPAEEHGIIAGLKTAIEYSKRIGKTC